MLGPIRQKDDDRLRHNLAHGQTTGRGIGPKLPYNVGRDLERDWDLRLDQWHAVPDRRSFAEIAIGLASRECELARQHQGYLRRAGSAREQSMNSVQSLGLLGVGGSRHVTYTCYRLRLIPTAQTTDLFCAGICPVVPEDSIAENGHWTGPLV